MNRDRTRGFFAKGVNHGDFLVVGPEDYELPNSVSRPVILVIHKVLQEAFVILRREKYAIDTAIEDKVSLWLRNVIVNQLYQSGEVSGFNRKTFEKVTRQQEIENFDGTKIRKTPDLVFCPKVGENQGRLLESHYGLFIECKPVGPEHAPKSHYCDKGVSRFLVGDYAWSMTEGMMVAYARKGRSTKKQLRPVFSRERNFLQVIEDLKQVNPSETSDEPLLVSKHRREFPWPHRKGKAGSIKIYHSWHCC